MELTEQENSYLRMVTQFLDLMVTGKQPRRAVALAREMDHAAEKIGKQRVREIEQHYREVTGL